MVFFENFHLVIGEYPTICEATQSVDWKIDKRLNSVCCQCNEFEFDYQTVGDMNKRECIILLHQGNKFKLNCTFIPFKPEKVLRFFRHFQRNEYENHRGGSNMNRKQNYFYENLDDFDLKSKQGSKAHQANCHNSKVQDCPRRASLDTIPEHYGKLKDAKIQRQRLFISFSFIPDVISSMISH